MRSDGSIVSCPQSKCAKGDFPRAFAVCPFCGDGRYASGDGCGRLRRAIAPFVSLQQSMTNARVAGGATKYLINHNH
jgi:hypothetical protein